MIDCNRGEISLWVVLEEDYAMGGGGEGGERRLGTRLDEGNTGGMLRFLRDRGGRDVLVAREVRGG